MAHRMLRSAGDAPPWIESDKEARRLLAELAAIRAGAPGTAAGAGSPAARLCGDRPRREPDDRRVDAEAPTARQHRRPLEAKAEVERLERAFGG